MEPERARNRVLSDEEYLALLDHCPPWLMQVCVAAWKTCLSRGDLLWLTWSEIIQKEGVIELRNGRGKTGSPQCVPIVTPELKTLIAELQAERRKVENVDGLVFTMDSQTIDELKLEYHFRKARKAAGIHDFTFHDFRHSAVTRWEVAGIPTAAAILAAGHTSVQSHKRYQNLQKEQLVNVFTARLQGSEQSGEAAVS